jgi:Putative amidase domain
MVKLRWWVVGGLAALSAVLGIAVPTAIAGSNGQQIELLTWSPLLSSGNHMGKVQICGDNQHNTSVCSPITALPPTQPYELHNWWFKGPLTIHEWTYNGQEVSGPCINPQDGQTPIAVPTSQASSTFVCDADFGPSAPFQPPPSASGSAPAPSTSGGSGPAPATGGTGLEHAPRGQIDRAAAAAWALANVNTAPNVFRDDCTDFVSEALKSGGGDTETVGQSSTKDWFFFMFRFGIRYSLSWSVAQDLAVHLNLIHSYWIRYWRDAVPGDVIFADWAGSTFAQISHVGIITGMRKGQPLITQHSPSQRNIPLQYWLTHGGPDVHVWIAVPNAG